MKASASGMWAEMIAARKIGDAREAGRILAGASGTRPGRSGRAPPRPRPERALGGMRLIPLPISMYTK